MVGAARRGESDGGGGNEAPVLSLPERRRGFSAAGTPAQQQLVGESSTPTSKRSRHHLQRQRQRPDDGQGWIHAVRQRRSAGDLRQQAGRLRPAGQHLRGGRLERRRGAATLPGRERSVDCTRCCCLWVGRLALDLLHRDRRAVDEASRGRSAAESPPGVCACVRVSSCMTPVLRVF